MIPTTTEELLQNAQAIAGQTIGDLATKANINLPNKLLHAKGLIGQLLEFYLGATAGSKPVPDFEALGIELKTIPVSRQGKPYESTYVCTVPLINNLGLNWHDSNVYAKLKKVLWIPIEAEETLAIANRRVGMGLLWSPTAEQENNLQRDWEEHIEKISLGLIETISAHQGVYLQIRPKAADSSRKTRGIGQQGEIIETLPRGFYLRAQFTAMILKQGFIF